MGILQTERSMTQQLDRTLDGVGSFSCDLSVTEPMFTFSPAACAINGLRADIAHTMFDVMQIQHPDDRARVVRGIEQAQLDGQVVVPHRIHRVGDHSLRDLVATIRVERDPAGRPRGVAGMFVDVTEPRMPTGDAYFRLLRLGSTVVLCVAGDVDMLTRPGFAGALHDAVSTSDGDLYLDCHRLGFIDLSGVEIVVETARGLAPDRRLICVEPPRGLVQVTGFLQLEGIPVPDTLVVPAPRVGA